MPSGSQSHHCKDSWLQMEYQVKHIYFTYILSLQKVKYISFVNFKLLFADLAEHIKGNMLQPGVNVIEIKLFEIRNGSPFDHLISRISKAPLTLC